MRPLTGATGMGNFVQTLVMVILLAAFGQTSSVTSELSTYRLEVIWRLQYAFAILVLLGLFIYRVKYLTETSHWRRRRAKKTAARAQAKAAAAAAAAATATAAPTPTTPAPTPAALSSGGKADRTVPAKTDGSPVPMLTSESETSINVSEVNLKPAAAVAPGLASPVLPPAHIIWLLVKTKWHRLIGGGIGWFVWDVAFYGACRSRRCLLSLLWQSPTPSRQCQLIGTVNAVGCAPDSWVV